MTSFRFLHAADIHLDSPLKGLSGQEGAAVERIRSATRIAFEQLVGFAIEEEVAFVVIAGDLYDGDWRDYNTGLFFVRHMGRLNAAGIPVYLLYGNHDAANQITKQLDLPANVHVFDGRKPQTFVLEGMDVALHGQSFRQRDITDNLALAYPSPVANAFNIGVLHTALGSRGEHENYAPCTPDDLVNTGYDYWALGHVHQADVVHEHPHIIFPGNLQGRHIRETGPKGACLITVEDGQVSNFETIPFDVVRWAVLPVDLTDAATLGTAIDSIRDGIDEAVGNLADDRLLVCRIVLKGCTELHEQLTASAEQVLADARAAALGLGDEVAWVEKIAITTESMVDSATQAAREDAIGELQRMLQDAGNDEELLKQLQGDIGELTSRLPSDARTDTEDEILKAAIKGDYAALIDDVVPYLTSRLTAREG